MAVHVVGYTDVIHYEGNTPVFKGRMLLMAVYNTAEYKALKPGEQKSIYPYDPGHLIDFVAPDPFFADLKVSSENIYGDKAVTFYSFKNDTYYPMFLSDFMAMVKITVLNCGQVTGRFGYVKKNTNFGIVYLGEN